MRTFAVARAVHGLEPLLAQEIERLGSVVGIRHREVWFRPQGDPLTLRLADDVLVAEAVVEGVGRERTALARLSAAARGLGGPGSHEVTASFVGRRNYNRYDLEDAVGNALGGVYHPRRDGRVPPASATSWRVTVEGTTALIGRRLGERPLHRRPYRIATVPGSLHPPVAAAMAVLGELRGTVLDPCCGVGTTLAEASAVAPEVRTVGLELNPATVKLAAAAPGAWLVGDAGRIPLDRGSVDRVLVNPPWGLQVPPAGLLARDPGRLWRELRRVLTPGGLAVALLYGSPERPPRGFAVERVVEVSLAGRHPAIAVLRSG